MAIFIAISFEFFFSLFVFFTGDKPHACELCNKRFALACNLRAHMKTHEGKNDKFSIFFLLFKRFWRLEDVCCAVWPVKFCFFPLAGGRPLSVIIGN